MRLSTWQWLKILSPILVIVVLKAILPCIMSIIKYKWRMAAARREDERLSDCGMPEIDAMDGEQFEDRLAAMFRQQGYEVCKTPRQGDFGADLILTKSGVKTAVQAKRHNRFVGNSAVQEALAGKAHYGCHRAIVITNSFFTDAAQKQAATAEVELWDRFTLADALAQMPITAVSALQAHSEPVRMPLADATPIGAPVAAAALTRPVPSPPGPQAPPDISAAVCRTCGGVRLHVQFGRYGYYLKCLDCDGNTPIRAGCSRCGSKERIRKSGVRFYAECDACRTSRLYWVNT